MVVDKGEFHVSHTSGNCCLGEATMFLPANSQDKNTCFIEVKQLRTEPLATELLEKYPYLDQKREYFSGRILLTHRIRKALEKMYFPGGMFIRMTQFDDHWLVAFKANDILASCYMALTTEDGLIVASFVKGNYK